VCKDQPRKPLPYPLYWRITLLFHIDHVQTQSEYEHSNRPDWISHLTDTYTKPEQTAISIHEDKAWRLPRNWLRNDAASHTNKRDNISCNIQHTRRAAARKLISFTAGFTNDVFGCITFWRRNYFFFILAHSVYKIWITQEPNTFELWNKLHFEEKKTESIYHV